MIHYKDLSWSEEASELSKFKKNDSVKAKVLEIDHEKEKLRLGIRQLKPDPFNFFKDKNKGDVITVTIKETSDNAIKVSPGNEEILITIKKQQIAVEKEDQRPSRFSRGNKADTMITELDLEKRKVSLSIKALEEKLAKEAVEKYGSKDSGASLGDILGRCVEKK